MTIDDTANTQSLVSDDPDAPDRELSSSVALFEGDEGALEIPQRRALVALLKNRFITARSHPKEWHTLIADPRLIRSRLNDQFMDLHLDLTREVAYKRQAVPEGGGRFPTLLHDTAWSREETILLVYLRSRARSEEAAGTSRTLVDRQDLLEHVASLRPEHATDQAGDARRTTNAIENLNRAGLLVGASAAEQFEVSPAVDVVLPLEKLQELLRWLQSQNSDRGTRVDPVDLTAYAGDTDISDEDAR